MIVPFGGLLPRLGANLAPDALRVLEKVVSAQLFGEVAALSFRERLHLLTAGAAVALVNRTPGAAERIGFGSAQVLQRLNPVQTSALASRLVGSPQLRALPPVLKRNLHLKRRVA